MYPYFSAQVSLLLKQLTQETVSLKNHTTNKIPSLPTKMKTNNTTTTTTRTPANKQIVMVVKTTMQTQNKLKEQKQPSNELLKFQLQLIGPQKLLATKNEANNNNKNGNNIGYSHYNNTNNRKWCCQKIMHNKKICHVRM